MLQLKYDQGMVKATWLLQCESRETESRNKQNNKAAMLVALMFLSQLWKRKSMKDFFFNLFSVITDPRLQSMFVI